ncbi:hypothetical protein [Clostridium tepidiprofundi]|nr:hypothetical protein [Clostridium tepidiprofundi]
MYLFIILMSFVISYTSINYKLGEHHVFVYIGIVGIILSILNIYYMINYIVIYDLGIKYKGKFYYYDELIKKEVSSYSDNTKKITFIYKNNELSLVVNNDIETVIDDSISNFNKK